jgi:hypothetical protein
MATRRVNVHSHREQQIPRGARDDSFLMALT